MNIYKEYIDQCSGSKSISILGNDKRALFGLFPGYISIFYRIFPTKFEIVNSEVLGDVLNTCDIETVTKSKFEAFLNEPVPFYRIFYYKYIRPNKYFILIRRKSSRIQNQLLIKFKD